MSDGGLCLACTILDPAILPQIAQNRRWLALMGKGGNESYIGPTPATPETTPEPPALPALGQPGRKQLKRLGRALAGEFTRTRSAA